MLIVYGRRASELCLVIMSKVAMILMDIEWVVCSSIMNAEERLLGLMDIACLVFKKMILLHLFIWGGGCWHVSQCSYGG